jgi:hypothetical protein
MKTRTNTRHFQRMAETAIFAVIFYTGIFAQPKNENNNEALLISARMEKIIESTEQSLKYVAPEVSIEDVNMNVVSDKEAEEAFQNLDRLATNIEKDLQYRAPDMNLEEAFQNLEMLAQKTLKELKYEAPPENEHMALMVEKPIKTILERSNRPVKVELYRTTQDAWLIDAGYYKTTRTPAWHKVKRVFREKQQEKEYASEL